jgi:hypothetical protein
MIPFTAAFRENGDAAPGLLTSPDRLVSRVLDCLRRKLSIRRLEFLQADDVRVRLFEPVEKVRQPDERRTSSLGYVRTGLRENTNGLWTPPSRISDIEKSARRDRPREFRLSAQDGRDSSPETRLLATYLRKCRLFAKFGKSPGRDRCGWLPLQDSNPSVSIQRSPPFNPPCLHLKGSFRDPLGAQ